ncbi:MAG: hypothetical protein RLZZ399_1915 [Verrucomicrobiota bacterium]|jgi:hypothetical protein
MLAHPLASVQPLSRCAVALFSDLVSWKLFTLLKKRIFETHQNFFFLSM